MNTRLDALRRTWSELGPLNSLLYWLDRLLRAISRGHARLNRYYFVAQPVPAQPAGTLRQSAKTTIRLIAPDDPVIAQFPRAPHIIAQRLAAAPECFVAESDGLFIGYLWLAYGHYDEDEVRCRFELADPAHCVWDYDVYVEPAHRLGRVFFRLWDTANRHLAAKGIQWSLSRISAFNPGSLSSHAGFGARHLFSAQFLTLGGLQLMLSSQAPYVHAGFGAGSTPRLRLDAPAAAASDHKTGNDRHG